MAALALALTGCAAAWRADGGGTVDLEPPPGWAIIRNVRAFGADTVALASADRATSITVSTVRDSPAWREVPLDMIATTRALHMGASLGWRASVGRVDEVEVAGRPAAAATGNLRWHQASADFSLVAARIPKRVVFVTLVAPPGELDGALAPWSIVLDSLVFPRSPVDLAAPPFPPDRDTP